MKEVFDIWEIINTVLMGLTVMYAIIKMFFGVDKEDADKIVRLFAINIIIYLCGIALLLIINKVNVFFSIVVPGIGIVFSLLSILATKDEDIPPIFAALPTIMVVAIFLFPIKETTNSLIATNTSSKEITQEIEYDEKEFEKLYNGESDDMTFLSIYNMCNN